MRFTSAFKELDPITQFKATAKLRDYSGSLAPQAVVVYDAFSRTTAEEGSMTMTRRWLGCSPLICQLARRKYPLSSFISSPSWWR